MVLVCHDHKFIFLKTRKTAGTSIEMLLEPLCVPEGYMVTEKTAGYQCQRGIVGYRLLGDRDQRPCSWRAHAPAHQVFKGLPRDQWKGYFRFSCLRNPFDRVISQFFWERDLRNEIALESFSDARSAFRKFVLSGHVRSDKSIAHRKGRFILNGFLRFEALNEDLTRLQKNLNLPIDPLNLPRAKSKTSRLKDFPISEYYDTETEQVVLNQMAWVFEQGKYSPSPKDADTRMVPPQQKWEGLKFEESSH